MRHGLLVLGWLFSVQAWGSNDDATSDRDRPVIHALHALGAQYRYGGRSPENGFDCSGLIAHVFERAWGVALPPRNGRFLHAPRPGALVRVEGAETAYWRARFNGARRLDPPTS